MTPANRLTVIRMSDYLTSLGGCWLVAVGRRPLARRRWMVAGVRSVLGSKGVGRIYKAYLEYPKGTKPRRVVHRATALGKGCDFGNQFITGGDGS